MSEWWTYRPANFLLFAPRTYYRLFELYNSEIWPGQVLALLVGLVMLALMTGAFALEALLLLIVGVGRGLDLRAKAGWIDRAGVGLVVFAIVLHPLIGPLVGRSWSQVEIFAIAPDPTVVATLGVVALASGWPTWLLLPIPIAWCLLSGATAWLMHSADAALMPLAGLFALAIAGGSPLATRLS